MKFASSILALAAFAATPVLAADTYSIDGSHTMPIFEVRHLGLSTQRGRFNKVEGKVTLDLAGRSGSVELTIDVASIDMGLPKWSDHMKSEDYFNAAKFPTMSFRADQLIFDGDKVVGADGHFTLLGVTRPLKIAVAGFTCGTHPFNKKAVCGGDISGTLKRSDFGMTRNIPAIGDEIRLIVPIEALKN